MVKHDPETENFYLDVPEMESYRKHHHKFLYDRDVSKHSKSAYYKSSVNYLNWYISYCDEFLMGKTFKEREVCLCVFAGKIKSVAHRKEYITKCLYISKQYAQHLLSKITLKNIHKYEHTISNFEIDLEDLIAQSQVHLKGVYSVRVYSWRRKVLDPWEIWTAAQSVFNIEDIESVDELHLRDVKPVVIFQIRQLLEIYGKNTLGYWGIFNKDGTPVKKHTHIAWEFIKVELKKDKPRIKFPFDVHVIDAIYKWANDFVHTTYIHNGYLQFYALKVLFMLFQPPSKPVKIFNGNSSTSFNHADIQITKYNSLKRDFKKFLSMKDVKVDWKEPEKVGAYVISL
jgi:hypothetical protein